MMSGLETCNKVLFYLAVVERTGFPSGANQTENIFYISVI